MQKRMNDKSVSLTKRRKRNSRNYLDSTSKDINSIELFNEARGDDRSKKSVYKARKTRPNQMKYAFSDEFLKSLYSAHNLILKKNLLKAKQFKGCAGILRSNGTSMISYSKDRKNNLVFLNKSPVAIKKPVPSHSIHKRDYETNSRVLRRRTNNVFLNNIKQLAFGRPNYTEYKRERLQRFLTPTNVELQVELRGKDSNSSLLLKATAMSSITKNRCTSLH